ncbi:23S rRNA (adenine(2503)-C(2))-methyltransferase [bacterium M21]|nr:23S rRNA (adenine(2503)-C(2))-methyltransferase [bacterium M21]
MPRNISILSSNKKGFTMNLEKIDKIIQETGLPKFRSKQLVKAFFELHISSYDEISTLKKELREELKEKYPVLTVEAVRVLKSEQGNCFKALVKLADGNLVETVLMEPKPGHWTTCISSQVGCTLGCSFCATGKGGFIRNLTSEEISDQVLFWRQYAQANCPEAIPRNVVYMGMGEPFLNTKNVFASIAELTSPDSFNMGSRHISVSTSGVLPAFDEFATKFPQVNLSVSLHASNDELRSRLMPINRTYSLALLGKAINTYLAKTNRKLLFEYVLLEDENDSHQHAHELVKYLRTIKPSHLVHVNLIPYNKTESTHEVPSKLRVRDFQDHLQKCGITSTIRKSLGTDIAGACGQLAGK